MRTALHIVVEETIKKLCRPLQPHFGDGSVQRYWWRIGKAFLAIMTSNYISLGKKGTAEHLPNNSEIADHLLVYSYAVW